MPQLDKFTYFTQWVFLRLSTLFGVFLGGYCLRSVNLTLFPPILLFIILFGVLILMILLYRIRVSRGNQRRDFIFFLIIVLLGLMATFLRSFLAGMACALIWHVSSGSGEASSLPGLPFGLLVLPVSSEEAPPSASGWTSILGGQSQDSSEASVNQPPVIPEQEPPLMEENPPLEEQNGEEGLATKQEELHRLIQSQLWHYCERGRPKWRVSGPEVQNYLYSEPTARIVESLEIPPCVAEYQYWIDGLQQDPTVLHKLFPDFHPKIEK